MNTQQKVTEDANEMSDKRGSIVIDELTKIYDPDGEHFVAIEDIDLQINAGEFITVLGPSGCGKSTLMNCIAGFLEPTSGHIYVDGEEVKEPSERRGVVFQANRLLPWKTIEENVNIGPKIRGEFVEGRASELLAEMGIEGTEDQYPTELSGGMQQRAEIARLLANDPDIMLMDEPFSALDALTKEIMQEMLLDIWEEDNRTVVFITHDVSEAIFLADRVIVMSASPGKIKANIEVNIPRPRDLEVTSSQEFKDIEQEVLQLIHSEAREAMGGVK